MEIAVQLEQIWGNVRLPVLGFAVAEGKSALIYQNPAARRLCPENGNIMEVLPAPEAQEMLSQAADFCNDDDPLFCHIGNEIYSAVFFEWNGCSVCVLHNVSSYYQLVQSKMNEAVMANRAKTSFLSEMSHDIRTPMNAIIGITDIALTQKDTPARIREYLNKIKIASGHMMSIINEVLDMSRIESGKIVLQPEEVEIADVLHDILIVAKPQADAKDQKFILDIGRIDRERIIADSVRLKQICLNLLSNAIKFTPDGGTITLFMEMKQEGGDSVRLNLYVKDTGIGMSREFLARVFTPFEREQSLTISKIQGTGLGTAIAKNLVELMHGRIYVESEMGKGSCFYIEIPFQAADMHLENYRTALSGQRLLLLDSMQERAGAVKELVRQIGMEVDWARTPGQAVDFINNAAFADLEYFAFLTVERVEGAEMLAFLPEVRKRMGSDFPILLLAESDWQQTEYMFTRAGVDAFIPLPLFGSRLYMGLYAFTSQGRKEYEMEAASTRRDFGDKNVLLVEDNELNREIAQEILAMTGVNVETAKDGQEALDKFSASPLFYYNLILMDIQMPVMNGLDATRALRAMDRLDAQKVPVVAMTANAFAEDVKNSLDAGMNAHVPKPLEMDVIFSCLDRFLTQ